ncbi:MAG: putative Dihydrolipoyl dehydrogenase, component of pyruvate and 2-oxoglutarate dehydrogenase [Chthoniobacteraceae bacterium]|nr:putative Dihydrolipoyl dehydrogenase, component of pyruvate and 2-oxoglutarate dehydrogenase [Chthoniobacteraceae bacterium]
MSTDDSYDFVVIGGGSAGYAGAATAAQLGLRTVVIESGEEVGGLCILRGCMPSKALLESARRAESIRRAGEFGLMAEYYGPDGPMIQARKRVLVTEFAEHRRGQLQSGRFDFVRGKARFTDSHSLEVTLMEGGTRRITGRAFLVATGSEVNHVIVPGLDETGSWDSDEVLNSAHIPKSVIVLGGGAIALEFASFYAGIGSAVTVLQRGPHLLKEVDVDVSEALREGLEKHGIRVFCKTALVGVERHGAVKRVTFYKDGERQTAEAEEIIYALGRRPMTEGFGLEEAGVKLKDCAIEVNERQQSSHEHIFAAGDVCGPFEVVHIAIQQGEMAARNAARLLGLRADAWEMMDYKQNLFVVFTHPEVAVTGLTEHEAAARGVDIVTASYPFADHGKSLVRGETDGFVKLLCARDSRQILGAAVIGPAASELIHEVAVALHFGAKAGDLARVPHYHPTLSEIWLYPAEELAG